MLAFCEAIRVGALVTGILDRADELGYSIRETEKDQILLIDSRATGRFISDLSISAGEIVGAAYVHND